MAEQPRGALSAVRACLWPPGRTGASIGAFLVPGVALWLPSGYSWGAAWLLLCALAGMHQWWRRPLDARTQVLGGLILLQGLLWSLDTGPHPGLASPEPLLKYVGALACLAFLMAAPPRPQALWAGLAVGGVGSGILALVETAGLGLERAHGFTNAIQYGNLSLLLGLMALVVLLTTWVQLSTLQRGWLAAGAALGLLGSMLSQTRGSWVTLLLVAPMLALVLTRRGMGRRVFGAALAVGLSGALAWPFVHTELQKRVESASNEVNAYVERHDAVSSIGQRLEHWRLAARMAAERPLLGWGGDYQGEMQRQVSAGLADPFVLKFSHAHNEWLDMAARRGLVGVFLLLLYLLVPAWLFWPARAQADDALGPTRLALSLVGLLLPLGYFGFGLTQVFFSHNSGHLFYLFMLILVHASLAGLGAAPAAQEAC